MKRNHAYCFVLALSVACSGSKPASDLAMPFDASTVAQGSACSAMGDVQTESASDKIALSWNGSSDVSVTILRKTYCDTDPYTTLVSLPAGASSYTDEAVQENYVYWYKLSAVDGGGDVALVVVAAQAAFPSVPGCCCNITPASSGVNGLMCSGSDGGS